jgi:hypothetical protein
MLYFPVMNQDHYQIPSYDLSTNSFLLAFYQAVYLQFLTNVEFQPKTVFTRLLSVLQSFLSFMILIGSIVFVFD